MTPKKSATNFENDWKKWTESRDAAAGDRLIESHFHLVDYHVQRIGAHLPKSVQTEDLRSHGLMGLYDALEKFDITRELKFDTYASFRIRGSIIDGLRNEDWLPRSIRDKTKKIEQTNERLEQSLGRKVTHEEIAKELGMSVDEVIQAMNESFYGHFLSIDQPAKDSEKEESYQSFIVDNQTKTPEQELAAKEQKKHLSEVIKTLNKNEQLVLSLFYFEEFTLTEIGVTLGLSTSRISQIHSKALFKLQQKMKTSSNLSS